MATHTYINEANGDVHVHQRGYIENREQIFDEVFSARAESPTVNISVVFAGLAIAAKATEDVDIQVIDVDNAYLK